MNDLTSVRGEILDRATSRTFVANGLTHRVLTFSGQTGADLVFVPGITSPAETVDFVAAALPEFTVHAPDLRGRGMSGRAARGEYELGHYRDDLSALITSLGLDSPLVVGHSLGARIAGAWALTPQRGRSQVVLVDPPLSGPDRPYPMSAHSFADQLAQAQQGTTADEIRRYFPAWPERELRLRAEVLAECDETAVLETHRGFEEEDFLATWTRLEGRVGLIHGEESPVVRASDVAELERRRPDIPIVGVAGAGHMVPWDNLPGFVEALRALTTKDTQRLQTHERNTP